LIREMRNWLLFGFLVVIITIRVFTETFSVLPRYFNFIDLFFLLVFSFLFIFYYGTKGKRKFNTFGIGKYIIIFVLVWLSSILFNLSDIYLPGGLLFLFLYLEPLIFALIILNLDYNEKTFYTILYLFLALGAIQIFIAIPFQLPRFAGGASPDVVAGTFGTNNMQMCFFLVIITFLLIGMYLITKQKRYSLSLLPVFIVFYAAGFRSIWLSYFLTIILVLFLYFPFNIKQKIVAFMGIIIFSFFAVLYTSKIGVLSKTDRFSEVIEKPSLLFRTQKIKAFTNLYYVFDKKIHYALLGVGPGSYSSRAFMTFANIEERPGAPTNVTGQYIKKPYISLLANEYIIPAFYKKTHLFGSSTIDGPFSSYIALISEVGLLGLFAYLAIYFKILMSILRGRNKFIQKDKFYYLISFVVVGSMIMLLQMSFFYDWLAVSRVTIPLWV